MNVLIVDDNRDIIQGMEKGLDWKGLNVDRVFCAGSAATARGILESRDIDLVLCDIEMPGESRISLIRWAREHEYTFEVIFLTSHAVFDYAREVISLGAFDYLLQPARYELIEEKIHGAAERIKSRRRVEALERLDSGGENGSISVSDRIIQYIREHIDEKISREELAEKTGFHKDSLTRIFRSETGYGLKEFINNEKIEYAKQLLKTTDRSISEIAMDLGFDSFPHFSQTFKKAEGVSPYRLSHATLPFDVPTTLDYRLSHATSPFDVSTT